MGYGAAVKTLMRAALAADAQYAVLLDADGQHDPTDIPKFLQALKSGADHAAGNRFPHTKMPTIHRLGYKALALLHRILIAKTLAILLEIVATLLITIAITSTTARKTNHIPHLAWRKLGTENEERSKVYLRIKISLCAFLTLI
jgi:glycosyltransferase involved in cell wall biosynthesis